VLVTYGLGLLIGAQLAGNVYNSFLTTGNVLTLENWNSFWWIPAIFAAAVMILFVILFDDKVREMPEDSSVSPTDDLATES
jgi:hypothetical protein